MRAAQSFSLSCDSDAATATTTVGKKAQFSSVKKREKDEAEAEAKAKAKTKEEGDEARPVQATAANCVMKINVYRFLKRMAGGVSWFRAGRGCLPKSC